MDKEWVAAREAERMQQIEDAWGKFKEKYIQSGLFDEIDVEEIYQYARGGIGHGVIPYVGLIPSVELRHKQNSSEKEYEKWSMDAFIFIITDGDKVSRDVQILYDMDFGRYMDSDPMEFDGDIIITDPGYIIKDGDHDDWFRCGFGGNMECLGIDHYMTRSTLYGDWSCTTFDTNTKEPIGEFCADAGLVSVLMLDEVLKYNPEFDYHINRLWTTTWIKDFKGTVQFVVKEYKNVIEEDSEFFKKGDVLTGFEVEVVGHGINKVTGEPIDFVGKQTGL